jgi:hypothetical protein
MILDSVTALCEETVDDLGSIFQGVSRLNTGAVTVLDCAL